jgi:hypothetical protein
LTRTISERRAEHLVAQHLVALEGLGVDREQRADRLVDAVADAAARQQLDAFAAGQLAHALLVGAEDAGGQHDVRLGGGQGGDGGGLEAVEVGAVDGEDQAGIGAELARAHRQRTDEGGPSASARAARAAGISSTGLMLLISAKTGIGSGVRRRSA